MVSLTSLTGLEVCLITFYLEHMGEAFAIREIARKTKIDYKLVHTTLQKLFQKDLLEKKRQANADLCSLKFSDLGSICYIENIRTKEFLKRNNELRLFFQEVQKSTNELYYSLILFGSFAKRKEHKNSDVDLLIITQNRSSGEEIQRIINTKALLLKRNIHTIVLDEHEFISNLSARSLNVITEVFKYHVILCGAEAFYAGVKKVYG